MVLRTRRQRPRANPPAPAKSRRVSEPGIAGRKYERSVKMQVAHLQRFIQREPLLGTEPLDWLRSLPCFGFEANSKISNVARQPQVSACACNTSSGRKYLVWESVKNCQHAAPWCCAHRLVPLNLEVVTGDELSRPDLHHLSRRRICRRMPSTIEETTASGNAAGSSVIAASMAILCA
jgi:hypothetical protein